MKWPRWPCKAVPRHRLFLPETDIRTKADDLRFLQPFHLFSSLEKVAPVGTIGSQFCQKDAQITLRYLPRRFLAGFSHQAAAAAAVVPS